VVSTAPQIRYPDCYGIDMAELGKFIAFQAAIALLKERGCTGRGRHHPACRAELRSPRSRWSTLCRPSTRLSPMRKSPPRSRQLVYPENSRWHGEVKVIYQTVPGLHEALGEEAGDWYFTGNYPTPWGYAVVNRSFCHFYRGARRPRDGASLL